jgi:U3 small nucleolar RNA-associated protein 13
MSGSLKANNDSLSKAWKVSSSREPFYSGGKVVLSGVRESESNQGACLVCMHEENVKVVDWNSGEVVLTLLEESEEEASDVVVSFAVHPENFELVIATSAGLLRHYTQDPEKEAKSLVAGRSIKAHALPILCMCYDPTGTLVATGSTDRTAKIWDIEKGYCTHSFRDHSESVSLVRFHPDPMNLRLVTASHDCTVKCFDLVDSKCVASYGEHMSLPTSVDWASDKYLMVSVGRDKVSTTLLPATIDPFLPLSLHL